MATDIIVELQQQRDSLKSNLQDVDESIKKLTGRDPAESRRMSTNRRIPLKRNSFGRPGSDQPPIKRMSTERRRWGTTSFSERNRLDSGGEEEEEKKPAVHSSVVATGKPIEPLQRPATEDKETKSRNRRMFGLLVGTLKQFKRESQVKTEQEAKQEEKLSKVEEQVQKDKQDALNERRELYQTKRDKQQELRKIEFKLEMAELSVEMKAHYEKFKDFIQLKSTPRVFYKPAIHNEKTEKLLEESKETMSESLEQRLKEIEMCNEEDTRMNSRHSSFRNGRLAGKTARDPIVIDPVPTKRDLFAEDADNDKREEELVKHDESMEAEKENVDADNKEAGVDEGKVVIQNETEGTSTNLKDVQDEFSTVTVEEVKDERRVVSNTYDVVDERVVKLSTDPTTTKDNDEKEVVASEMDDDVNIYGDVPQELDLFQSEGVV
ncbi:pinin-like [Hydractinia symbiolongicarpus]|uniref:pinin-like n=1 Tax=Hydractinia symbiolongicarpus TaxID=13093 RepID=UPI00254BB957|nr:pinin-like [Hydractinia symbiolongicarpus]